MSELVGKTLGPYEVVQKIRATHTNTLYKAFHQQLGRFVALQVVLPDHKHPENLLPRLKEYARILSRLSHPNIGLLLDCEMYDTEICLAYDFTPRNILRSRFHAKMGWEEAARALSPVAQALSYAHQQGVIHGHIRPESILINTEGSAVLFDFGLELLVVQEIIGESAGNWLGSDGSCYAPPEQTMGKKLDAQSDIYSLGMVLYQLVTGQRAYQGERSIDEVVQQLTQPLPAARRHAPQLPRTSEALLRRSLAKDPSDRFQDMQHMATLLARIALRQTLYPQMLRNPNWRPRRLPSPILLATSGLLAIALLGLGWLYVNGMLPLLNGGQQLPPSATSVANVSTTTEPITPKANPTPTIPVPKKATPQVTKSAGITATFPVPTAPVLEEADRFPLHAGAVIPYSASLNLKPDNVDQMINLSQIGIGWLNDIAWNPQHDQLAAATTTGLYLLNSPDYTISRFIDTSGPVLCASFSPDGGEVATGDPDGLVRIWSVETGLEVHTLGGHLRPVRRVVYSQNGERLVSVSDDFTARLWDPLHGSEVQVLKGHVQPVTSAVFSPTEQKLVTVSSDFKIFWWDSITGALLKTVNGHTPMLDAAFSSDGATLYTSGNSRAIEAWSVATDLSDSIAMANTPVTELEISPNGEFLAAAESNGKVTVYNRNGVALWSKINTRLPKVALPAASYTNRIGFTADSKALISGIWDNTIRFWQAETGQETANIYHFSDFIKSLAVSPGSAYLAGQLPGDGVKVWNLDNGQLLQTLPGELMRGRPFSRDERMLAVKINQNTVAIFQVSNGKEIYRFGGIASIRSITFSNNGAFIAAGDSAGIKIWSLSSGQELSSTANYGYNGCTIASPLGGDQLAIANPDHYIGFLNDVNTGICVINRVGWMKTLDYRVDGSLPKLAVTGGASRMEVWDYNKSGKREDEDIIVMGIPFGGQVEQVALSPVADLIAGALNDYTIGIWQIGNEQGETEKIRLASHHAPVTALVFTPNGKFLISSSLDGTVRIWGIDPGE